MNTPPAVMNIEIKDEDVKDSLPVIIQAMSRLREEAITSRDFSDRKKDEYLHLAYRLASGIEACADEKTKGLMITIAEQLNKNPLLLKYDSMQARYWKEKEGQFTQALDDLLMSAMRDRFESIDETHHILQAVKFLGTKNSEREERLRIFDSILPFHSPNQETFNEPGWKKFLGRLLGTSYKLSDLENLALGVDCIEHGIADKDKLLSEAEKRGYSALKARIGVRELEKHREELRGYNISEPVPNRKPRTFLAKTTNALIKFTKPISYPIIGALPRSLQERIGKLPDVNTESAFHCSEVVEVAGTVLGTCALTVVNHNVGYILLMIPLGIDSIARHCISDRYSGTDRSYSFEYPVGSFFLKPFFYPLEKYLDYRDEKEEERSVFIEFPIRRPQPRKVSSPVTFYEAVCQLDIPAEIEENLVWGLSKTDKLNKIYTPKIKAPETAPVETGEGRLVQTNVSLDGATAPATAPEEAPVIPDESISNHNQFGQIFLRYIQDAKIPGKTEVVEIIDRRNQAVVYNQTAGINGYTRNTALFCFSGRRYILTAVESGPGRRGFIQETSDILSGEFEAAEKLEKICKRGIKYAHLREYREGRLTGDLEALN